MTEQSRHVHVILRQTLTTSLGGAVASAATRPATFPAHETATGATLAAAQSAARQQLNGDFGPCSGFVLIADGQNANGTWWAEVGANCTAFH
jgi:hypothetical protein